MKLFLLCLLIFIQNISALKEWDSFKATYQKKYKNADEEIFRKKVFLENLELIKEQNKKYERGLSSFSVGVKRFTDLTKKELFSSQLSRQFRTESMTKRISKFSFSQEVPDSIDWRDYGVISRVSDQLVCQSCWAFAVVGAVEAHVAIKQHKNVSLSEQNLIDCVDPNFTCDQYLDIDMVDKTYQYIIENDGIDTVESYPNIYYSVGTCQFSSEDIGATIRGYANVTEADEEELKFVVGTTGPVTVVFTTDTLWSVYQDGVYYKENCMNTTEIFNHVAVIVGYGNENGEDYWLVKNSWGVWFGNGGYIKMARNRDNNCGIASIARYPIM